MIQEAAMMIEETLINGPASIQVQTRFGQALHISPGTVMSRLNRARQAVLRFYREEHHEKKS
jgi:hypothetical protein